MTALTGLAGSFTQLALARIGVGVGEAGCSPPAHSLISDYFPAERRGTALAIYQLGVPLGMLFGLGFGGYLADQMGWRTAFLVVGAPGVLLALITRFTLREPPRGQADTAVRTDLEPFPVVLRFMWRLPALRHMMIGSSLQTLALAAWGSFNPAYLQRVHGLSGTEAGLALGLIAGVAGSIATFGSGWIGDRLARHDPRWYFWLPAIGAIVSLPFSVVAYTTSRVGLAIAMLLGATLGHYFYSALAHVVAQSLVRPRMRATMSAIALFMMNIVGFGLGPAAIGALSDALGGGTQLRYAMLGFVVFMAWAALHYVLGARSYRADLEAKHAD
jgi:predicted MFS family arabinose efflux permease